MKHSATPFATSPLRTRSSREVASTASCSGADVDEQGCISQLPAALHTIQILLVEGLKHGFFEYSINCETVQGGKRRMVVRAGKSHQFTIPEHELTR